MRVGDAVRTLSSDGTTQRWSDVIYVEHKHRVRGTVVELFHSNGGSLRLTPTHLVMSRATQHDNWSAVCARDVAIGAQLAIASSTSSTKIVNVIAKRNDTSVNGEKLF